MGVPATSTPPGSLYSIDGFFAEQRIWTLGRICVINAKFTAQKMIMEGRTIDTLVEDFAAAVAEVTGAPPEVIHKSKLSQAAYRPDVVMELEHEGDSFRLVIEAKRSLFPRDAREAMWQLRKSRPQRLGR